VSNKFTLTLHSLLIVVDVIIILVFITMPQQDKVHGGLGQALMALYGLGLILLLLLYEGLFLVFYFKNRFKAVRVMWWLLASVHLLILFRVAIGLIP